MKKDELVIALRTEAWEIRELLKKIHKRCDKLDALADDLESEYKPKKSSTADEPSKFRQIVDALYGEKPKRKTKG